MLSVIIPVFNEVKFIEPILNSVINADAGVKKEIIVVDDYSNDGTREILQSINLADVKIFYHGVNKGKGGAISTGISHANGDIILFQDADLEYDPSDYKALVAPILAGSAVVYGSRFLNKSLKTIGKGRWILPSHYIGNKFLTMLANILYHQKLTDMETGYKVFKADVIKSIKIESLRFDMEPEITAKILKKGIKIFEVPINYHARDFSAGKKITWIDGIKAAIALAKYRLKK